MILRHLELTSFRNYEQASFSLHPAGNLVIAPNGTGKTNLLEAMAYCGLGKSVHFHRDEDLRREGASCFALRGGFQADSGMGLELQIAWQEGKKLLKINGNAERKLSRVYECVKIIYSAPEDMNLVGGNPRFRRQYFDLAISQIYPEYITLLRNYLHVVEQRNAMLKRGYERSEKSSWDSRFAALLLDVVEYRDKYLSLLNDSFQTRYPQVSEQVRDIRLRYLTQHHDRYPAEAADVLKILSEWAEREKRYQRTLIGPHLDDYAFQLDGHNLKTYGSQGQKRITVIILKLIQAALIERLTGIKPIVLFDDVFAELDVLHTRRIHEFVDSRYQVFIASPREDIALEWKDLEKLKLPGVVA